MNRKQFIGSHGGECRNWTWSWSFVNEAQKVIIFGAWDRHTEGQKALILSEDWKVNARGKKNAAYGQSRDHIRLVEEEGFRLMTFPLKYSTANQDENGIGPARIDDFVPELTEKTLLRIGGSWYASDGANTITLPEELPETGTFAEGAKKTVTINAYERSSKARRACIAHHGAICIVCNFDFRRVFGAVGEGFIHVHHIIPIGSIGAEYKVNPITDLVPVCPNCHAIIHRTTPVLTIKQIKELIDECKEKDTEPSAASNALTACG